MTTTAIAIIKSLSKSQIRKTCLEFDDTERTTWFYTPTDHGGLPLSEMTPTQHRLVHSLVSSGLSTPGYNTVAAILGLDNILDNLEGFKTYFGRDRGRDPTLYYLTIFGSPGKSQFWAWRFGGHHISLNYTLDKEKIVSVTPSFLGADPADSPLLGPHLHRPLAGAEDLGRELFRSLGEKTRTALISNSAPVDISSGNRPFLTEGDKPMHLLDLWRGTFDGEMAITLRDMQENAERILGISEKKLKNLAFSVKPKGLKIDCMNSDQHEIIRNLFNVYLDRLPEEVANQQKKVLEDDRKNITFAWAGSPEKYNPHYYRIQGKRIFIEYDNTQRDANHIHTVWRDLRYDFGGDILRHHYETANHHSR